MREEGPDALVFAPLFAAIFFYGAPGPGSSALGQRRWCLLSGPL